MTKKLTLKTNKKIALFIKMNNAIY